MSSISENTKSIAVIVLAGNEFGFELIITVIAVKHRFVIFSLNIGLHGTRAKLINKRKGSQNSHQSTNYCHMLNICEDRRTEHQLAECQCPVNSVTQSGMHGFKVKRVSDIELDVVHGWTLLISLFWLVAAALAAEQACKEPEHFRLASAS